MPFVVAEILIVLLDTTAIKLLACFETLQQDTYSGMTWPRAGVAAAIGNASSFFEGIDPDFRAEIEQRITEIDSGAEKGVDAFRALKKM